MAIAHDATRHLYLYDPYGAEALPHPLGDAVAQECAETGWGYSALNLRHLVQPSSHFLTGVSCAVVLAAFDNVGRPNRQFALTADFKMRAGQMNFIFHIFQSENLESYL